MASDTSGVVFANGDFRTVVRLGANPASAGDNSLVAAVASTKYRILAATLSASAASDAKFRSATTDISCLYSLPADGSSVVLPYNQHGWFETAVNEALNLNLQNAAAVGVQITYIAIT
jgi:hypothetical protein